MNLINFKSIRTGFLLLLCLLNSPILKAQQKIESEHSNLKILVLFNTVNGGTYKMAKEIAAGIEEFPGARAVLKQVPRIKPLSNEYKMPFKDIPYATISELANYDGIAFGSAVHFGNMTADMRYFLDESVSLWTTRKLEGMPGTVFMSAGSGAGREAAILSFWNTLAIHGMMIVPTGMMGTAELDKTVPQGNTAFGASSLASLPDGQRPSKGELYIARLQGYAIAKAAKGCLLLKNTLAGTLPVKGLSDSNKLASTTLPNKNNDMENRLKELNIVLPDAPAPVGNYKPYKISGKQVFINQIALKGGKVEHPGMVEKEITEEQAKQATRQTLLNILSVLKVAAGGDLNNVKQTIQLTGFFYTAPGYTKHAVLMNEASDLLVEILGEKGIHTRATIGASSLPLNSPVEIQAIFELN